MRYYLGIDAGGTKTFVVVGEESGKILSFGRAGAGNYEAYGVESARNEIWKAVSSALNEAQLKLSDIKAIGMGIAGADIPEDYEMLEREIFTPMFRDIPRCFRNDSMAGLRGGTKKPYGIVIACGTGCVCAGKNRNGKEARVGGISEEFGDRVSGSSIGQEGLRMVWRYRDKIVGYTKLVDKFLEKSGCKDVDELFYKMYKRTITYDNLEPMAKLVFDSAFEGDRIAADILEWGGRYLGEMVNACARILEMTREQFDVVMAGSVFKGSSPVLKDSMTTVIHRECPLATPVMPIYEPVIGAFLLGLEVNGKVDDSTYQELDTSLTKVEEKYNVQLKSK
ncbi:MAG: hypothetical protein N3G21_08890 [Candidatus Hydrogenedentes bacterium]|nr:hypothetical protein [Candidatus Hydrogenedentota bacterium]